MRRQKISHADRPLFIFSVGVYGSEPFGVSGSEPGSFANAFRNEFDNPNGTIKLLARDDLKAEINGYPARRKPGQRREVQINDVLAERAVPLLRTDYDVIASGLSFNRARTRAATPLKIANSTGALSVALYFNPPVEVIRNRAGRRTDGSNPGFDFNEYQKLEPPDVREGIDYIFDIDSRRDNPAGAVRQLANLFERLHLFV